MALKQSFGFSVVGTIVLLFGSGCGDKPEEAQAAAPAAPPLSTLELPVALRSQDAAPANARKVEVSLADVRVDDQVVLALANGNADAAERKDGTLPKLAAALASPARDAATLALHASLSYETAALVLNTVRTAGIRKIAFRVRKPGGSTDTGWLGLTELQTVPRTDDDVPFQSVEGRSWDDFAGAWQAVYDACRGAQTGSCAYVASSIAKGGKLKIVLHASGQGVNVNFFRVGLTPEQLAAEQKAQAAELAKKKEDVVQGRVKQTDVEEELLAGPPADEALFQFRAREAVEAKQGSVLTQVMQPLCGSKACGAVVSADSNTLAVRVISLIGAAFADGAAPPSLAFELPWTEKPKAPPPPPAEPAPAK